MSLVKKTFLNTAYQLIGKAISLVLGLATTAVISQSLSVADYGRYIIIIGLILQVAAVAEWGTGFIAVRAAAQSLFPRSQIFINLVILRLIMISSGGLLLVTLSLVNAFNLPHIAYLSGLLVLFPLGLKNVLSSYFQSQTQFHKISLVEVFSSLFYLGFLIALRPLTLTLPLIVTSLALCTWIAFAVGIFLLSPRPHRLLFKFDPQIIRYLLINSAPIGGQLLVFNLYNRLDTYLLQLYKSEVAVARYGLAYKIYENSILLAAYLMNSLFPEISRMSHHVLHRTFNQAFQIMLILGLSASLSIYFLSPWLINLINPSYQESILPLRLLGFGLIATYLNHLTGYTFTAINKQLVFMWIAGAALILNSVLNLYLIPQYSYTASALITVATEVFIALLSLAFLSRYGITINLKYIISPIKFFRK